MYGAILGDVVGSRFEFDRGPWTKEFEFLTDGCNFTDDSVMTIAVGEALMNAGNDADVEVIKKECIKSMKKWGKKYPNAGYGARFIHWVLTDEPTPYNSLGNGSAMRVSAAGWLYDSIERTREVAKATAEVSHNHPEGIKGAECTAAVTFLARNGASKDEIKEYVTREFGYDISKTVDEMRPLHRHDETCMDALPKALISFFEGESYEDVVRNAVSLGGDTDTIAAIAGAMAEAMFGMRVMTVGQGKTFLSDDIIEVLNRFDEILGRTQPKGDDPYENNIYIKMAVDEIYANGTNEDYVRLLYVLAKRIAEEGEAPTPMVDVNDVLIPAVDVDNLNVGDTVTVTEETRLRMDTMTDGENKQWFPLFTDHEELSKQPTTNININAPIRAILENGLYSDRVEGVVINPFGESVTLNKDILKIVFEQVLPEMEKR